MAIKPVCDKYKQELNAPGGLLWSPPKDGAPFMKRDKYHLCAAAWNEFVKFYKENLNGCNLWPVCDVGFGFSPPEDITSAGETDTYYIRKDEWSRVLEWLGA